MNPTESPSDNPGEAASQSPNRSEGRIPELDGLRGLAILAVLFSLYVYSQAAVTLLALVITFLLAAISWRFLEKPLIQRGHRLKYDA